jgi:hypothetical protein
MMFQHCEDIQHEMGWSWIANSITSAFLPVVIALVIHC